MNQLELDNQLLAAIKTRKFNQKIVLSNHRVGYTKSLHQRGYGSEFSEYRQYELGDNPRNIDWGHYARSDKLYLRVYHEERALSVMIVLDVSNSMTGNYNDNKNLSSEKWLFSRRLSLALAAIGTKNGDSVSLYTTPENKLLKLKNISRLHMVHNELMSNPPSKFGETGLSALKNNSLILSQKPNKIILISDFLEDEEKIEAALKYILKRNTEIIGLQIEDLKDQNPFSNYELFEVVDSETNQIFNIESNQNLLDEYQQEYKRHIESLRKIFQKYNAKFISLKTEADVSTTINTTLVRERILS